MLKELRVRDLALVESAEVRFGPGLNLLTGETGSGKSLIIDALGLALGARASTDQVRHGAERAVVDAAFADGPSELVLTREVGRRGAARIDGRPAAPGQLRESARRLVAVHGQHEHQALMDPEAQTDLLDAFAGSQALRAAVAGAHERWTEAAARLAALERARNRGDREREYMALQLEELTQAGLREGEDLELAAERSVARHATRLHELSGSALLALSADEGLPRAVSEVRAAAELDGRLGGLAERLAGLEEEVADASSELRRYAEGIDADPRRLEAVEERLSLLESIKRRYGGALSEAIAERDRLAAQLGAGEDLASAIESARARAAADRADLLAAAAGLTRERERASRSLSQAVAAELQGLHLEGARFEVRLEPRPEVGPAGAEQVLMQFSANPGEPLAALARVASGGELARVMLAIKTATAEADSIPTLVFDEVDAGIGGEAALQVGLRLKALGGRHQVLVVTHLPQVACFADHHLLVEKAPGGDGRNVVRVRELEDDRARAAELARMMSGRVTDKALARALELLEEARGA